MDQETTDSIAQIQAQMDGLRTLAQGAADTLAQVNQAISGDLVQAYAEIDRLNRRLVALAEWANGGQFTPRFQG